MSFLKTTKPKEEPSVSYRCVANGCPLNGPISLNGGQWMCSFHFRTDNSQWPQMTETIRNSEAIFGLLDDLRKISEIEWSASIKGRPPQREMYFGLFDDQPELKPGPVEKKIHYEYRLMDYVAKLGSDKKSQYRQTYTTAKQPATVYNPSEFF